MIYSQENFNGGALKQVVPTSTALSWNKMQAPLENAEEEFLLPILGRALLDKLQAISEASEPIEYERQLLFYARKAVGNLAFFTNFDELNVRITDQGFQRQTSQDGTFNQAYKYQEENLKKSFKNKGFNAVDSLVNFLGYSIESADKKIHSIGELWKATDTYKKIKKSIVPSINEVQVVYDIHSSALLFLTLQAKMATIEELTLQPVIGRTIYDALKLWLEENVTLPDERHYSINGEEKDEAFFDELRLKAGKVVIMKAVLELLRTTGSITDRGMFYQQDSTSTSYAESNLPTNDNRLQLLINDAQSSLNGYINALTSWLNGSLTSEENHILSPYQQLERDNDGKKAFWT